MDLPDELAFERLSFAEKYHRAVPGYMRRVCDIYEAVYERFGDDGLDLIREVSRRYGAEIGLNVKKKGDLKGVAQVGKYLLRVFDMVSDDIVSLFTMLIEKTAINLTPPDKYTTYSIVHPLIAICGLWGMWYLYRNRSTLRLILTISS